jgi:hypothetical protein
MDLGFGEVSLAQNEAEALAICQTTHPDLIIFEDLAQRRKNRQAPGDPLADSWVSKRGA